MTTEQYWANLDALGSAKGTDRLLDAAELLRANPALPLLISCRRVHDRIQHLFTTFDEQSPDATGNRYLICFTSTKQAERTPSAPAVDQTHEAGPSFENLEERYGKRRKKGTGLHGAYHLGKQPSFPPGMCWPTYIAAGQSAA